MIPVPDKFAQFMVQVHGAAGQTWLDQLPALVTALAEGWKLTLGEVPAELSYNYVITATREDGTPAVLKVGVPSDELYSEMDTLAYYQGMRMVRLLEKDKPAGALLEHRALPGNSLADIEDNRAATAIAAQVMRGMWKPVPPEVGDYKTIAQLARGFDRMRTRFNGGTGPIPARLVEKAERLFAELLNSSDTPVLLHGDLHHFNILADGDQWVIIDPKGVIGAPEYEVAQFLFNPWEDLAWRADIKQITQDRIAIFSEVLEFDRKRIMAWAFSKLILSAWWCVEDNVDCWRHSIELARTFEEISPGL